MYRQGYIPPEVAPEENSFSYLFHFWSAPVFPDIMALSLVS